MVYQLEQWNSNMRVLLFLEQPPAPDQLKMPPDVDEEQRRVPKTGSISGPTRPAQCCRRISQASWKGMGRFLVAIGKLTCSISIQIQ